MKKSSVKVKGGQNKTNSLGDLISLLRRLKVFRPFFTTSTKNTLTGRRSNYIKSQTAFRVLGTVAISSLVLLFATVIAPIYNTTNSAEATTGTATESTLTFTSNNATASVNLAVNDTAGTFATSTEAQKAAFSIATDNYTGYTLTIKSSSCTTSANCKLGDVFPSITSSTTSDNFAVNTWGYIPSYYNSAANTANYYPAPTTSAATLRITSGPNATEDEYTIGLGIKADFTNPSGTYANETFVLEYVANPAAYSITYDKGNTTGTPSNIPTAQSSSVSATSVTLSSTVPTLTGYTFTGWCMGTVSTSSAEIDTCTGTGAKTFAAGGTFGIDRTSTNSVTLHAMWSKATVNVTVDFAGSGVTGVTFTNTTYGNVTVSTSGNTAALKYGVSYTITGTYSSGYGFSSWSATAGSLGSTSSASTTYSTTTAATLTLTGKSSCAPVGSLYCTIASMSKGKQTNDANTTTGIQAAITAPTSTDRTQDTSNSGVYEYDASLFGASSDASNDYPIYYYRGILEPEADQGGYGSDGKATTYPNYVKLSNDTCWRILRTTGSGGVKLIYNGTYGATTSGSCANAQTNAQVITSAFNNSSASNGYTSLAYQNIHAVGYTYNNSVTGSTTATAASTVLGSNSSYSVNSSPSIMKQYLENTWYKNNMTSYTSKLEPSAGYCNDRSLYADGSYTSALDESTTIVPYGTSSMTVYYFGPYTRNSDSAQKPSLTCPRNVVDLYTTSGASNGNKQLTYPVALVTADEMSFAGSGNSTASNGSSYNAKSFARSGWSFWLLSPYYRRSSSGSAGGYYLGASGNLSYGSVNGTFGVRPVISLTSGTTPASGSGTATDPWVVTPPPTMQDATSSSLADLMPNVGDTATLVDSRDGESYLIGHLADGKYWMLDNLALDLVAKKDVLSSSNTNATDTGLGYLKNGGGTTSDQYATSGVISWPSSSYSYSVPWVAVSGDINGGGTWDVNTTVTSYGSGSGKVGAYYNYCAASAGTYCYGNGTSYGTSSGDATADICPYGWQMPSTTSSNNVAGSYYYLYNTAYSANTTKFRNALSTPLSGYFYDGSARDQGSNGIFWSSTRRNNYSMYYLRVNSSVVGLTYSDYRRYGYSVRCVLK